MEVRQGELISPSPPPWGGGQPIVIPWPDHGIQVYANKKRKHDLGPGVKHRDDKKVGATGLSAKKRVNKTKGSFWVNGMCF